MTSFDGDTTIITERLSLAPLRPEDAEEMVVVLADEQLHEFIGGRPTTLDELRVRYVKLAAGSTEPNELWLNWIVRRSSDFQAVGTVQATLTTHESVWTAHIAWVIGAPWQNQGFASEATRGLVDWLHDCDTQDIVAHIHPDHAASATVATRAGLQPTDDKVDGEQVWRAAQRS